VERALSVCVDRRQPIPPDDIERLLTEARARRQRLLLAQVLRARGVQSQGPDDLREALDLFRAFGARPLVARAEIELGQLLGDRELEASGIATLEALGDLGQLGRVAAVARRA
jgi:hypothetical protein